MTKRALALVLAALMLVTLFAGCNTGTPATTDPAGDPSAEGNTADYGDVGGLTLPLVDERVDISWMTSHDNVEWTDTPFVEEVLKRTGVYLDIINVPVDARDEKTNTFLASGKLPNIIQAGLNINQHGEEGAYINLLENLDKMPNLDSYLSNPDYEWYIKSYRADSGALYNMPQIDLNRDVNHMWLYRKDIFDANNIDVWEAGDSVAFYEALKALKAAYPNSYPYSAKNGSDIWRVLAPAWDINGYQFPLSYDEETGLWEYAFFSDEMKEILDYHKTFINEGLLDPEFLTNTSADWNAKFSAPDKSFVTWDWITRTDLFEQQVAADIPGYDLEGAAPWGPTGKTYQLGRFIPSYQAISAVTPNWEVACGIVDYFYSPSGAMLETIGVEGEWFNFDENGVPVYTDPELTGIVPIGTLAEKYGIWNQSMMNLRVDRRCHYLQLTPNEQRCNDVVLNGKGFTENDPVLAFTNEETEAKVALETDLLDKSYAFCMKYVMENGTDADWDKWVNEDYVTYKVDDLLKIYNDAQARYDAE